MGETCRGAGWSHVTRPVHTQRGLKLSKISVPVSVNRIIDSQGLTFSFSLIDKYKILWHFNKSIVCDSPGPHSVGLTCQKAQKFPYFWSAVNCTLTAPTSFRVCEAVKLRTFFSRILSRGLAMNGSNGSAAEVFLTKNCCQSQNSDSYHHYVAQRQRWLLNQNCCQESKFWQGYHH